MTLHLETPEVRPPTATELDPAQTSAPGIAPPVERQLQQGPVEGFDIPAGQPGSSWAFQTMAEPGGGTTSPTSPTYQTDPGVFRAEASSGELSDFASQGLQTPGRVDSALVSDIGRNIDLDLAEKKKYAGAELDEFASQRGLVGSNIELDARRSMIGDFERQRSERMTSVQTSAANAWAADRSSAADVGFRSGEFERSLGGDRENANRFGATFGQGQYEFDKQFDTQESIQQRALDLQEKGMDQDEAFRRAQSEVQQGQFESQMSQEERIQNKAFELQEQGMSQEDAFRYAQLAQDDKFSTKAQELQQQGLDQDEAFRRAEMDQQDRQFAEQMGLSIDQFNEQKEQFSQQFGEQVASRLQQAGQFSDSLEAELSEGAAGRVLQTDLAAEARKLQREGMGLDESYRRAALKQENDIQTRAMDLQEKGMTDDDSYRYAVLAQDEEFGKEAQRLQREGMELDEAYRNAALSQADRQFAQSSDNEKLDIILRALSSDNVNNKQIKRWLSQTSGGTATSLGGGATNDTDE